MNQGILYLSLILGGLIAFVLALVLLVNKTDVSIEALNISLIAATAAVLIITLIVKSYKRR